jgi:hypothetical protein
MAQSAWRRWIVVLAAALALTLTCCSKERDSIAKTPSGRDGGDEPSDAGDHLMGPGCGASQWPASGAHTLDVDGTERTFIVRVPDGYDSNTPYKLVFAGRLLLEPGRMRAERSVPRRRFHHRWRPARVQRAMHEANGRVDHARRRGCD